MPRPFPVRNLSVKDTASYAIWLRAKRYSPDTVSRALRVAEMYLRWADGKDADDRATVMAWLAETGERVRRVTALNYHKDLSMLFRWAVGEGLVAENPLDQIPKPRPSIEERERDTRHLPYSEAELEQLLAACPERKVDGEPHWLGLRDRAILRVLFDTPLRASEICGLECDDVDWQAEELRVRKGKGGTRYEAVLSAEALYAIDRYLRHRPHDGTMLFTDQCGGSLSRHALYLLTKRLAKRAGWTKPVCPHLFRHNWRARMVDSELPDAYVSAGMGHKNVTISYAYARQAVRNRAKPHIRKRLG